MSPTVTNLYREKVLPQTWDAKAELMKLHPKQLLDMLRATYHAHVSERDEAARVMIKEVLDTKPHVPNKKERKAARLQKVAQRNSK